MTKIYELQTEQWVMFFSRGTQLILQYKEGDRVGRPILLANDYSGGFRGAYYEGTLYYLYVSSDRDILLRNIRDNMVYYQIRHREVENGESAEPKEQGEILQMGVYEGELILWYLNRGTKGTAGSLQCLYPFKPGLGRVVLNEIPEDVDVRVLKTEKIIFLLWIDRQGEEIYRVDKDLQIRKITNRENSYAEEQKRRLETALEEIDRLRQILGERAQKLEDRDQQIKKLQGMIDSAKSQYEELMHVAEHYRDEAIRWRSKFTF